MAAWIAAAMDRGEPVNLREALSAGGVGHTRQEAVSYHSALADAEDYRANVRDQLAYQRWLVQRSERMSGDTTAPTREERELTLQRAKTFREKTAAKLEFVGAARAAAASDADARERLVPGMPPRMLKGVWVDGSDDC